MILTLIIIVFKISPTEYVSNAINDYNEAKKEKLKMKAVNQDARYTSRNLAQIKYNTEDGTLYEEKLKPGIFSRNNG